METLKKLWALLAVDKQKHIGLGLIYVAAGLAHSYVSTKWGWGAAAAFDAALGGVLYEVNQKIRGEGTPDPWDALASAAPGAAVWGISAVPGAAWLGSMVQGWLA